jgi:iron-sulfur cluster repair protein YtfE (RIC family)
MRSQSWYTTEYAGDVVDRLTGEHDELRARLGRVLPVSGAERREAFAVLRNALTEHEAAEGSVVRPLTREAPGGDEVAGKRSQEEEHVRAALAVIEQHDVDSVPFEVQFRELEEAVRTHLEKEEKEEFPLLRQTFSPDTLRRAAAALDGDDGGAEGSHGVVGTLLRHLPHPGR